MRKPLKALNGCNCVKASGLRLARHRALGAFNARVACCRICIVWKSERREVGKRTKMVLTNCGRGGFVAVREFNTTLRVSQRAQLASSRRRTSTLMTSMPIFSARSSKSNRGECAGRSGVPLPMRKKHPGTLSEIGRAHV